MDTTDRYYQVGDIANGHIWNGHEWVPIPSSGEAAIAVPWYRKPWAFVLYGSVGALVLLTVIGAALGGTQDEGRTAAESASVDAPAAADEPVAEVPEEPVAVEEPVVEEQAVEPAAPANEQDSLTYQNEVADAQKDIADLREDIADLERDLSAGSLGWASWNFAEISFNVAQLQSVQAPPSIAAQWDGLVTQLTAADELLSTGFEADSISQMQSGIAELKRVADQMDALLGSW